MRSIFWIRNKSGNTRRAMSDLNARHNLLGMLGITPWYPRQVQPGARPGACYVWSAHAEADIEPSRTCAKQAEAVGQLLKSLRGAEEALSQGAAEGATRIKKADSTVSAKKPEKLITQAEPVGLRERVEAGISAQLSQRSLDPVLCIGVVQAGDWQFCFATDSASDLAIESEAAGKIVAGIRSLPGWRPPESRTFVWPPLPRITSAASFKTILKRFIEDIRMQHTFYQVMAGPRHVWDHLESWPEVDKRLRVEGEGLSWTLSDPARKRHLWAALQALCR